MQTSDNCFVFSWTCVQLHVSLYYSDDYFVASSIRKKLQIIPLMPLNLSSLQFVSIQKTRWLHPEWVHCIPTYPFEDKTSSTRWTFHSSIYLSDFFGLLDPLPTFLLFEQRKCIKFIDQSLAVYFQWPPLSIWEYVFPISIFLLSNHVLLDSYYPWIVFSTEHLVSSILTTPSVSVH